MTASRKLTGTMIAEKNPKEAIGMIFESPVARKATEVVREVMSIAFPALFHVKSRRSARLLRINGILPDCFQVSVNTNTSSAATPITTNIAMTCSELN